MIHCINTTLTFNDKSFQLTNKIFEKLQSVRNTWHSFKIYGYESLCEKEGETNDVLQTYLTRDTQGHID